MFVCNRYICALHRRKKCCRMLLDNFFKPVMYVVSTTDCTLRVHSRTSWDMDRTTNLILWNLNLRGKEGRSQENMDGFFILIFYDPLTDMRGNINSYFLVLFGLKFVSWISIKSFPTFLEVKIDIHWVNLTHCQAHWVL